MHFSFLQLKILLIFYANFKKEINLAEKLGIYIETTNTVKTGGTANSVYWFWR
jgi:hypothetical protein